MPAWFSSHESVSFDPAPPEWRCRAAPTDPDLLALRRELGLPTDRPVVMSGHQAAIWHAGIAAKVFALDAASERFSAASAWIVVDQDLGTPGRLAYPSWKTEIGADGASRRAPIRRTLDLLPSAKADVVTGRQSALRRSAVQPDDAATPDTRESIGRVAGALAAHADDSGRAMQATRAALDLLGPFRRERLLDVGAPVLVSALALSCTPLFVRLFGAMRDDAGACTATYNAAVAQHPDARLRPLAAATPRGPELPLWRIDDAGRRHPVFVSDLGDTPRENLAPRALTMTALLRWGACDLFIHGLGGGRYDPVMERWLADWLGVRDLAPAVVVSATRLLPMVDEPPPTPEQVARARWAAHHARHDPVIAVERETGPARGDDAYGTGIETLSVSDKKCELADAVARATGPERAARFRAMHQWLAEQRAGRADALRALDARAAALAEQADLANVVFDRTWPFPLLPAESMRSLADDIHTQLRAQTA
ncbi:MAG: hypothetical protein KDA05_09445 [Phycisphaerales bacterium]|nr:hypothetical protein [Phycisphaerales bacterium]